MATRPKAVIESRNGEKFSPITITKNVLTDDGQNLHDILSNRKEDMMTPTIENSSSMFKVGQGDNVDYSSNIVNGAYESMVLKGKTMVNCIQESSSQDVVLPYEFEEGEYVTINDTKESGALGVELKGQTLVNLAQSTKPTNLNGEYVFRDNFELLNFGCNMIKPSTTYTIISNIIENSANFLNLEWNTILDECAFKEIIRTDGSLGIRKFKVTSKDDLSNASKSIRFFPNNKQENGTLTITFMLLEGDYTKVDIPYFTGMQSVKMPILHTVGKNLATVSSVRLEGIRNNCGSHSKNIIMKNIPVEEGKTYTISGIGSKSGNMNGISFTRYEHRNPTNSNNHSQLWNEIGRDSENTTFTIPKGIKYVSFTFGNCVYNNNGEDGWLQWDSIQLEEGSVATSYEQHKSSILSLPEEVVLRSLPNGVCDTFNTRTGVYTQRIGEVVLDGSDSAKDWMFSESNNTFRTSFNKHGIIPFQGNRFVHVISDKYTTLVYTDDWNSGAFVSMDTYNRVVFRDDRFSSLIDWHNSLKQDAITVQYILETPVTTKINLPSTLKSWNTTTHIYSEIPENTLYPILSYSNPTYPVILKPSTEYSIVANSYSNDHTNSTINFNLGGATATTTVGNRVTTITTPSTLSNELLTMSGRGNKLNNVMVIEGDVVGDEPYFEGICDCKSPILLNCGKNLFDGELEIGRINATTGENQTNSNMVRSRNFVEVKPSTTYTLSYEIDNGLINVAFYGSNKEFLGINLTESSQVIGGSLGSYKKILTTNNTHYLRFYSNSALTITDTSFKSQLEESPTPTTYEPYKSNILHTPEEIVLRSLPNGVCDTLNVETGEYAQRIGEVVFDGSEDENWRVESSSLSCSKFVSYVDDENRKVGGSLWCNAFNGVASGEHLNTTRIGIGGRVVINTDKALTSETFKQWLSQNPITVQYEFATPIVTTIDIQGFPYAYTNGHVILSSGSIEQSLTPKVEYSVATNRNGQIRSNQKMVERHQKQLDRLQAMILTNLVNTQYEQALTNLKYDLKNVREEVK